MPPITRWITPEKIINFPRIILSIPLNSLTITLADINENKLSKTTNQAKIYKAFCGPDKSLIKIIIGKPREKLINE
tara:strand:- start:416 stop:643 length:228 start_codon:yes stop_codon:yes gene_type:complete